MIRPIVTDVLFLARKAEPACAADASIADDLLDTLKAHKDDCVGMAANMIGEPKSIIVFDDDGRVYVFHGSGRVTEMKEDLTGAKPGGLDRQLFERGEETALLEAEL